MEKSTLQLTLLCGLVLLGTLSGIPTATLAESIRPSHHQQLMDNYGKTPLSFEKNQGQTDDQVKFLSRGQGYALFLTQNEAVLSLNRTNDNKTDIVRLQLIDANPDPIIEGASLHTSVSNYLIGNNPSKWHTNVQNVDKVHYRQVYDGIDLVYYGNQRRLEYDYIVSSGADPKTIRMRFAGAKDARIDESGKLILHTPNGQIVQQAPISYQKIGGQKQAVSSRYVIDKSQGDIIVSFEIGEYDTQYALIIDPILNYFKDLGGSARDEGNSIVVDASRNIYITGQTQSIDFPVQNAFQNSVSANYDAFVAKFDASGTSIIYATYLGGNDFDEGRSIAVDASGNAYITGSTRSANFPLQNAFQNALGSVAGDAFIAKLDPTGNTLLYATYLGGNSTDIGRDISIDASGNAYIVGDTHSGNFPVQNAIQNSSAGNREAFISKLDAAGNSLVFSTFLGGSNNDEAFGITLDQSNNIYIAGDTNSSDFPTLNAYQSSIGGNFDTFIAKLDASGNSIIYATYLGGSEYELSNDIAVNSLGNVYVTGYTLSSDFPTMNAVQSSFGGGYDAFVAKLDTSGTSLAFATYFGGDGIDQGWGIKIDALENVYVTGYTTSSNLPTLNAVQNTYNGNNDAFVAKLTPSGTSLLYATYLGNGGSNIGKDLDIDQVGNVYVTGTTIPTSGIHNDQVLLAQLSPITLSASSLDFGIIPSDSSSQQTITLSNSGPATLTVTNITATGTDTTSFSISPTSFNIPTGQSKDITVTFTPASTGTKSASISISNNISENSITVSLSGQASPRPPTLSLSTTSLDFGNVFVGSSSSQTVTLSNPGDSQFFVTNIWPTGADSAHFTNATQSFTLSAQDSQVVTIVFAPTSSGSKSASLKIMWGNDGNVDTITLNGEATAPPAPTVSGTSLDFGNISVDSSADQTITLSNTGTVDLNISGITLSGTDASLFTVSPTTFTVSAGQSQTVTVTFAPTSTGSKSASLSIAHNASGNPNTVSLSGQGTAPTISLSETSLDFGNISVGNNATQTVTLSNTGNDTLKISSATISGSGADTYSATPTIFNVLPSQNQIITVTTTPTTFGALPATLSIIHNASGSPTSISLTTMGTAPDINLSANTLSFGDVETNTEKTLTLVVSNNGNADLTVSNVTSSNAAFTLSPTTFTITANNNQGVGVTFKPTSVGEQSATVTLTTNDPDETSLTVSLTGTGTEPATPPPPPPPPQTPTITFSSQNISFGDVLSGQTNSQTITISNTGNATLSISDITLTGDAFSLSASTGDIAPGQNQQITVTFSPTSTAAETGSIAITHNAGSQTVIPLTGTGVVQPAIHIATTDLDFGQVLANTTGTLNLTISNTGNANLEITNITFTNPRFETASSALTIAGGDSQAVAILFRPVTGGLNTGTLTITHNASSDPIQISLSGEGTLPLGLQITPAILDFARVDINGQQSGTLQLQNPGTDTLNIITLQTHRLDFQVVQGDSLPIALAPSESRVLDLLFFPRRSGITTGDLSLTTQDSTFTIPLQGEGVVAQPALTPHLEITPTEITFSNLSNTQSDTTIITLSNTQGTGTLFVTDIQSNDVLVTANADSFIIKPGEQKSIQIIAQAAERTFPTGQINISSNDPISPTASLTWRAGILLNDMVMVDLDTQASDQNIHRLSGALPGDTVTVQLFAKDFPPITGYGMFVDYDTNQMTFLNHALEPTVIPGATEQISASNGQVNLGLTSFTGVEASGDAFLGTLSFVTSSTLTDSTALTFNTITLSLANSGLLELPQRTSVWIVEGISPDFTGDGRVDFRDFLLFGQAFGSSDPQFDLNGDGAVGFPDFIIFAAAFGS